MNFKTDMQAMAVDLINRVFGSEGGVSLLVTIKHPILANIDEITGKMYHLTDEFEILGIVGPWEQDAVNPQVSEAAIKVNDLKLIVPFTEMPWMPTADLDSVWTPDGSRYNIISITTDAAFACSTMQLRKLKGAPIV
jgi:hypothetical protein